MHAPEVERVVVRAQRIAVGGLPRDVARDIGVVVVVAHRVENRDRVTAGGQQTLVVGHCKVVVVPIAVPGHVACNQAVDRQRTRLGEGLRFGQESVAEALQVVLLVGQMEVGTHQHHVTVVVDLHEFEIVRLADLGPGGESGPESHHVAVEDRRFVSRGQRDEDIAQRLGRCEPIEAVFIGHRGLDTVGNPHAGHAPVPAIDNALEVAALLVGNLLVDGQVDPDRGDILLRSPADHVDVIGAADQLRRDDDTGRLGRHVADGHLDAQPLRAERQEVARLETPALQRELLALVDAHHRGEIEVADQAVGLYELLRLLLGAACQRPETGRQQEYFQQIQRIFHTLFMRFSGSTYPGTTCG